MDTSISQARNLSPLKKLAVVALCGGAGFAVTAALIYARNEDGILSHVLPDTSRLLDLPVFIPPGQRTAILFSMDFADIPTRNSNEPDAAFHERVRKYLEQRYGGLSGFVVFDNTYRYEVDLPKWSAEAPSSK